MAASTPKTTQIPALLPQALRLIAIMVFACLSVLRFVQGANTMPQAFPMPMDHALVAQESLRQLAV